MPTGMMRSRNLQMCWMGLLGSALLASQMAADLSELIQCQSYFFVWTQCNPAISDRHLVSVTLNQQLSTANCTANVTYGITSNRTGIWVDEGCRGNFTVFLETDGTTSQEITSQRTTSGTEGVTTKVETSVSSVSPPTAGNNDAPTKSTEEVSSTSTEVTSAATLGTSTASAPSSEQTSSGRNSVSSNGVTSATTWHGVTSANMAAVSGAPSDAGVVSETTGTSDSVANSAGNLTTALQRDFAKTSQTSTDSSPTPATFPRCYCSCSRNSSGGEAEISSLISDKASFSKSRRKKESSRDDRTFSVVMGTGSVAMLCAVALIFPLLDLNHVIRAAQQARRIRQMQSPRSGASRKTDA